MCWTIQTMGRTCCTSTGRGPWIPATRKIRKCSSWRHGKAQGRTERICGAPKNTIVVPERPRIDRLSSGTTAGFLEQGKKLVSANGKYEAEMQSDGNFVIYAANRQAIWATAPTARDLPPTSWRCRQTATWSSMEPRPLSGPAVSTSGRRRTRSSCRMTAISSSTTTRRLSIWAEQYQSAERFCRTAARLGCRPALLPHR